MSRKKDFLLCMLMITLFMSNYLFAQEKKLEPEQKKLTIKKFEEVITKEAIAKNGVFNVYQIAEKWYYEIPTKELGRLFLWVSQIKKSQSKVTYGGMSFNNQVVRWSKKQNKILLEQLNYALVADENKAVYNAVESSTLPALLASFDILAFGKDSSLVIDVTDLFLGDKQEFSPKKMLKAKKLDTKRSYIDIIKPFTENIEATVMLTYEVDETPTDRNLGTVSLLMNYSMVHLPETPMLSRLHDSRVGFFSISQEDYGRDDHSAKIRRYITKWRLEKKDPSAEVSEPIKPIVFYVDRSVPEKWKEYFKKGIEDWQPAFEKAGFKNAIIGKYAPSVEENPNWSTEDATVSSVAWLPSTIENAFGPHVHDPRTGEIIEADIKIYHNVMNLLQSWYFVQVSPMDERAQKLPLPDDLMGELLRYVVAHEVGHSLGFPHNGRASSAYPVDSLRSATFTNKYGNESTIMDYGRFNYVAQPGDNARLIPLLGPYDYFAVEWGYKPIKGAKTPDDELTELDKLARLQDTNPFLEFSDFSSYDPTSQTEDMGDDAVEATKYGLKNIDRIIDFIIPATTTKIGDDYSLLKLMYTRLIEQRNRELNHVVQVIGGVVKKEKKIGQFGDIFIPIKYNKQKDAIKLLTEQAFKTPFQLLKPEIFNLISPEGIVADYSKGQSALIKNLLDDKRISRMIDNQVRLDKIEKAYTVTEFIDDLKNGLFLELKSNNYKIDPFRQKIQRFFIEELGSKLVDKTKKSDLNPFARGILTEIKNDINRFGNKAGEKATKLHLEDLAFLIESYLNPTK